MESFTWMLHPNTLWTVPMTLALVLLFPWQQMLAEVCPPVSAKIERDKPVCEFIPRQSRALSERVSGFNRAEKQSLDIISNSINTFFSLVFFKANTETLWLSRKGLLLINLWPVCELSCGFNLIIGRIIQGHEECYDVIGCLHYDGSFSSF